MTQTFIIIKPDAVTRGLVGQIIDDITSCGFEIIRQKELIVYEPIILDHYDEVIRRLNIPYLSQAIVEEFVGKTVLAVELIHRSKDAILEMRSLIGATDPKYANPDTIRGKYGNDSMEDALRDKRMIRNLIHASDNSESVIKEILLWLDV
jgi:nucleoside-diphosphate kinase